MTSGCLFSILAALGTIYRNLGAAKGGLPKFRETAFVHRSDFPGEDDARDARSRVFYEKLVANRKVMYFAP